MARLEPLPVRALPDLGPELEAKFKKMASEVGFIPNSFRTMARRPEQLKAFANLCVTMYLTSTLPRDLVAMVSQLASLASGCRYCQAHTFDDMKMSGVSKQKQDAIWTFETSPLFTEKEKAAMRVALGGGAAPNAVTDEDVEVLKQHFSDDEIVEIVGWISLFGYLNRWNDTLATTLEDQPKSAAVNGLAQQGWEAGKHAE